MRIRVTTSKTGALKDSQRRKLSKLLKTNLEEHVKEAARLFAKAAVHEIPTDTGFARGAFRGLAKLVDTTINIRPKNTKDTYYRHSDGSRILKKPGNSAQFATAVEDMIVQSRGGVNFTFEVAIIYFQLLDPRRWRSLEAGRKAFLTYINAVELLIDKEVTGV